MCVKPLSHCMPVYHIWKFSVHVTCRPEDGKTKEFYWFPLLFIPPSYCNLCPDRATAPFSERVKRCSGELCYWLQRATTGHRVNVCKRNLIVRCGECCRVCGGAISALLQSCRYREIDCVAYLAQCKSGWKTLQGVWFLRIIRMRCLQIKIIREKPLVSLHVWLLRNR